MSEIEAPTNGREADQPPAEDTPSSEFTNGPESSTNLDSGPLGPEELAALRERAAQADALKDRVLRVMADLDNFRKRAARERQEAVQYANQGLLERLLPALDNLDMASAAVAAAPGDAVDALKTGVHMVLGQLRAVLKDAGLEEINAEGQAFDPAWHEAVSQQESTTTPDGHVVQQLRKGYRLHQRLLRPATVVVARAPQAPG